MPWQQRQIVVDKKIWCLDGKRLPLTKAGVTRVALGLVRRWENDHDVGGVWAKAAPLSRGGQTAQVLDVGAEPQHELVRDASRRLRLFYLPQAAAQLDGSFVARGGARLSIGPKALATEAHSQTYLGRGEAVGADVQARSTTVDDETACL